MSSDNTFHLSCFYFSTVFVVGVPFSLVFGARCGFDCVGSWSLPFYLLCDTARALKQMSPTSQTKLSW